MADSKSVGHLCEKIRERINRPRKQNELVKDTAYWNMLCSSMDAVGDTELALDAYLSASDPSGDGARYLLIFGVLQVLFVQQDAVENLARSLGVPTSPSPLLHRIREVRNDSVGHLTRRGRGRGKSFNFISRATMRKSGFDLMTIYSDSSAADFQHIELPTLIADQREELSRVLAALLGNLLAEEAAHIEEFGDSKMTDLLPTFTRYALGKLSEAVHGDKPKEYGLIHLDEVERAIAEFRTELARRGIAGAMSGLEFTLNELDYPISELRLFFENRPASRLNQRDASIFVFFVATHFDELRGMAKEIDKDYESGGGGGG